jgi:hypothetical protein
MTLQAVPRFGEGDAALALWIANMPDETLDRLAFACVATLVRRAFRGPHFRWTAPTLNLQIVVNSAAIDPEEEIQWLEGSL